VLAIRILLIVTNKLLYASAVASALAASANAALAQIDPGVLNPGVLQREYLPPIPNQPQLSPTRPAPEVEAAPPTSGVDDGVRILIKKVIFLGNTKVSNDELQKLASKVIDKQLSFAEIEQFTQKVTALYRSKGYFISVALLPKQNISTGELKIQIFEGYIEKIQLQQKQKPQSSSDTESTTATQPGGPLERWLLSFLQPVVGQSGGPLTIQRLERQLLLAEANGGIKLGSVLSPGSETGSSILTLQIIPDKLQAFLGVDNWVPSQLGNVRGTASIYDTPVLAIPVGMSASGSYTWPVNNGLSSLFYSASLPLGKSGLTTSGSFSFTETNSFPLSTGVQGLDLTTGGESYFGSWAFRYPLKLNRLFSTYATAQLDLLNSANATLAPDFKLSSTETNLRTFRIRLEANKVARNWSSQGSIQLSQGLSMLGSVNNIQIADLSSEPYYGQLDFTTAQFNLAYQRSLTSDNKLQVSLRGMAQAAKGPTPSAEQIGFGGNSFGKGYRSVTILGDQGVMGSLELSYMLPNLINNIYFQPYAFVDGGSVSLKPTELGFSAVQSVATAGLGLRLFSSSSGWLSADAGYGVPFSSNTQAASTGFSNGNAFFRVTLNF
jgi:hemolysin activation/secretion protein